MSDTGAPGRAVGVDVGGTKLLAVALDGRGDEVAEARAPSPLEAVALVDAIADAARAVGPVGGLAVGLPGLVDGGVLRFAPNLPGVIELPAAAMLAERIGAPVILENDATLAAWGEHRAGAAVGIDDALVVTLGTGIGAGLVLGGRLYRGAHGMAGEIGHMLVDPNGPPCPCGQRGCWERYASGSGLRWLAQRAVERGEADAVLTTAGGDAGAVRGEHVVAAATAGDSGAQRVIAEYARWVAVGLGSLVNVFDPAVIVLGGGVITAGEIVLGPVRQQVMRYVEAADHRPPVEVRAALLGERAGALGAAFWARENFFR